MTLPDSAATPKTSRFFDSAYCALFVWGVFFSLHDKLFRRGIVPSSGVADFFFPVKDPNYFEVHLFDHLVVLLTFQGLVLGPEGFKISPSVSRFSLCRDY